MPDLGRYDDNIRNHLAAINARRPEPITLRYFQYLSLLYTEVYLDWRFNQPGELLRQLNQFVAEREARRSPDDPADPAFTQDDLNKLAYWMATGSGKTLIMHANYRQFLHYNREGLDNILLITPNEGLTEQHLAEMETSGIRCERFNLEESGLRMAEPNTVRVIEITKLVEEKRGGGVSVPVDAFEGNNLIFVDEGHKGSGGEAWRRFRDALGKTGFTFEYSATFGQALTAARDDELTAEYGKAPAPEPPNNHTHGSTTTNATMSSRQIRHFCKLDAAGEVLLKQAMTELGLSARAHDKVLRIARTIADLEAAESIQPHHLAEAIQYRRLDRKL